MATGAVCGTTEWRTTDDGVEKGDGLEINGGALASIALITCQQKIGSCNQHASKPVGILNAANCSMQSGEHNTILV